MLKTIEDSFEYGGQVFHIVYKDAESFEGIPRDEMRQVYGICFHKEQVAIVEYENDKPNLPGGKIEDGGSWEDAFRREINEELNMKVISVSPIGYQFPLNDDRKKKYELRVVAIIKPNNRSSADPAGTVTGYRLVEPKNVNALIDYGPVGEQMIKRALSKLPKIR